MRADVIAALAECRVRVRAHAPAAAVGLLADPQAHAPHLRPRPVPGAGRPHPRRDARHRPDHRRDRRLPGRDGGRLHRDASRSTTRSASTTRSRSSTRPAPAPRRPSWTTRCPRTSSASASSAWSSASSTTPGRRNEALVGTLQEVLVEGTSRTDDELGRGRSRGNKTVLFAPPRSRRAPSCRCGSSPPPRRPCAAPRRSPSRRESRCRSSAPRRRARAPRPSSWPSGSDGEIVSADAMQLYAGLPMLSNQPSAADRARVPHHLVGVWPLTAEGDVARYAAAARAAIDDIAGPRPGGDRGRRHRPLPAGGARRPGAAAAAAGRAARAHRRRVRRRSRRRLRPPRGSRPGRRRAHPPQRPPPRGARAGAGRAGRSRCIPAATTSCGRPPTATRPASSACASTRAELHRRIEARTAAMFDAGVVEEVRAALAAGRAVGDGRAGARPGRDPRRHRRRQLAATRPAGAWSSARASTPGGRRSGCAASPASSCSIPPPWGTWNDSAGAPRPPRHRARARVLGGVRRQRHLREAVVQRGRHGRRVPLGPLHDRGDRVLARAAAAGDPIRGACPGLLLGLAVLRPGDASTSGRCRSRTRR